MDFEEIADELAITDTEVVEAYNSAMDKISRYYPEILEYLYSKEPQ